MVEKTLLTTIMKKTYYQRQDPTIIKHEMPIN